MGLFGGRTELALELDGHDVVAGAAVVARVRVGEPDKKARGARVELRYRNTFEALDFDDDDDRPTPGTRREDVVVLSRPIGDGQTVPPGEHVVELTVPAGAPGTAPGTVDWSVRAVVDRKLGGDVEATAPLTVRVPAAQLQGWAQEPPQAGSDVTVELGSRQARPGQELTGTVTIAAGATVRSVRARLRRVRSDQDGQVDQAVPVEVVLASAPELAAGGPASVPLTLRVPDDAPPSFQAQHNQQHWYLEVVVDRPRAVDDVARLQVVVHTA